MTVGLNDNNSFEFFEQAKMKRIGESDRRRSLPLNFDMIFDIKSMALSVDISNVRVVDGVRDDVRTTLRATNNPNNVNADTLAVTDTAS